MEVDKCKSRNVDLHLWSDKKLFVIITVRKAFPAWSWVAQFSKALAAMTGNLTGKLHQPGSRLNTELEAMLPQRD
jgi:hypothetical protein